MISIALLSIAIVLRLGHPATHVAEINSRCAVLYVNHIQSARGRVGDVTHAFLRQGEGSIRLSLFSAAPINFVAASDKSRYRNAASSAAWGQVEVECAIEPDNSLFAWGDSIVGTIGGPYDFPHPFLRTFRTFKFCDFTPQDKCGRWSFSDVLNHNGKFYPCGAITSPETCGQHINGGDFRFRNCYPWPVLNVPDFSRVSGHFLSGCEGHPASFQRKPKQAYCHKGQSGHEPLSNSVVGDNKGQNKPVPKIYYLAALAVFAIYIALALGLAVAISKIGGPED